MSLSRRMKWRSVACLYYSCFGQRKRCPRNANDVPRKSSRLRLFGRRLAGLLFFFWLGDSLFELDELRQVAKRTQRRLSFLHGLSQWDYRLGLCSRRRSLRLLRRTIARRTTAALR